MMNRIAFRVLSLAAFLLMAACADVDTILPPGEKGDRGADGLTAYELWKEALASGQVSDWDQEKNTEADFAKFLQGRDGKDGRDGTPGTAGESAYSLWKRMVETGEVDDPHSVSVPKEKWPGNKTSVQDFWKFLTGASGETGQVPHIGENGNWFIGLVDTKVPARGEKGDAGKDAHPPVIGIDTSGNWTINGVSTEVRARAKGNAGTAPVVTIDESGYWVIDGLKTDVRAKANDGDSPVITINADGFWMIDNHSTGIPAFGDRGADGRPGADGPDAYMLWVRYISDGSVDNPHEEGEKWPADKNTKADFWYFLSNYSEDGSGDSQSYAILPLVAHQMDDHMEYVNRDNGSVRYCVYKNGVPVGKGYEVSQLPALVKMWGPDPADPDLTFTTDENGEFAVPAYCLPNHKELADRKGTAKVKAPEASQAVESNPMVVYNRVNVRVTIQKVILESNSMYFSLTAKVERETGDGNWTEVFPASEKVPNASLGAFYFSFGLKDPEGAINMSNLDREDVSSGTKRWYDFGYNLTKESAYSGNSILLTRPISLDEDERGFKGNDFMSAESFQKKTGRYAWDGQDHYITVVNTDYGTWWFAEEKVLVPEIYSAPSLKAGSLYIDESDAQNLILWGEFDPSSLNPYYLTFGSTFGGKYTEEDVVFEKQGDRWLPKLGRIDGDLDKFGLGSCVLVNQRRNGSSVLWTKLSSLESWNFKFKVDHLSDQTVIYTYTSSNKTSGRGTSTCEYRERANWRLEKKEDGSYILRDPYDENKILTLEKKAYQKGWETK